VERAAKMAALRRRVEESGETPVEHAARMAALRRRIEESGETPVEHAARMAALRMTNVGSSRRANNFC